MSRGLDEEQTPVMHVFVDHQFQRAIEIIRTLIKQLLGSLVKHNIPCPTDILHTLEVYFGPKSQPGDLRELFRDVFKPLLQIGRLHVILVDGLDECEFKEASDILRILDDTISIPGVRLLISSRENIGVDHVIKSTQAIWISPGDTREDIVTVADALIREKCRERRLVDDGSVIDRIHQVLCDNAGGM